MGPRAIPIPAIKPEHVKRLTACLVPVVLLASVGLAGPAQAAGPAAPVSFC